MKFYSRGKKTYRLIKVDVTENATLYRLENIRTEEMITVGKKVFNSEFKEENNDDLGQS